MAEQEDRDRDDGDRRALVLREGRDGEQHKRGADRMTAGIWEKEPGCSGYTGGGAQRVDKSVRESERNRRAKRESDRHPAHSPRPPPALTFVGIGDVADE